jgi:hypothetical protein
MSAQKTTCLPVTELVYSCEITDTTNPITDNNEIEKIIQGYLRVLPEVTRDATLCTMDWSAPTKASSSSSSSSAKPTCCPKYYVKKQLLGLSKYNFTIEVSTEEVVYNNISHWEVELTTNPGQPNSFNEVELVQNEIDPDKVSLGYDMIYPVGNGKYRFIGKQEFITYGTLVSVFSVPIPTVTYNNAHVRLRSFADNGCITEWCEKTLESQAGTATQEAFVNCCSSIQPSIKSSSPTAASLSSSSSSLSSRVLVPSPQISSSSSSSALSTPIAACCLPNGQCIHVTADAQGQNICGLMGGTYMIGKLCNNSLCSSSPRLSPSGSSSPSASLSPRNLVACCLPISSAYPMVPNGSCYAVTDDWIGWWDCVITHWGEFNPNYTCADSSCVALDTLAPPSSSSSAKPVAACCLYDGTCITVEGNTTGEYQCALMGGVYDSTITCQASPCALPPTWVATCCVPNQPCQDLQDTFDNWLNCIMQGGEYMPYNTCATHPCLESSSSAPQTSASSSSGAFSGQTFNLTVSADFWETQGYLITGTDRNGVVSGTNPVININLGDKLIIDVNAIGHPFWIKTAQGIGTSNPVPEVLMNGGSFTPSVKISWIPVATGTFYYNCEYHVAMTSEIIVS